MLQNLNRSFLLVAPFWMCILDPGDPPVYPWLGRLVFQADLRGVVSLFRIQSGHRLSQVLLLQNLQIKSGHSLETCGRCRRMASEPRRRRCEPRIEADQPAMDARSIRFKPCTPWMG